MSFSKFKYALIGLGVIIGALFLRGCFKDKQLPALFNQPLPDTAAAQVVVADHHIAVRSQVETKAGYVPDGARVVSSIGKNGAVSLDIQSARFMLRPIVGGLITSEVRVLGGLQVGYWNRFEIYAGAAYPHLTGFVGLGYRLDQLKLNNTSVFVAYTLKQEIGAGVLLRF